MQKKLLLLALIALSLGTVQAGKTEPQIKAFNLKELYIEVRRNPDYYWGKIIIFYAYIDEKVVPVACIHFKKNNQSIYVHSLRVAKKFRNQGLGAEIIQWFKDFIITDFPKAQSINWVAAPLYPDEGESVEDACKRLCDFYRRQNAIVDNGNCSIKLEKQTLWQKIVSSKFIPQSRL